MHEMQLFPEAFSTPHRAGISLARGYDHQTFRRSSSRGRLRLCRDGGLGLYRGLMLQGKL